MPTRNLPIFLFLLLLGACGGSNSQQISDALAAELLETSWNKNSECFLLGELQVMSPLAGSGPDRSKKRISGEEWQGIEQLAGQGVFETSVEKDLTERFSGWRDWMKLTQEGVAKLVTVEPGPKASEVGEVVMDHPKCPGRSLRVVRETYSVEKILRNEAVEHPIERYRLVSGLHTAEPGALFSMLLKSLESAATPTEQDRMTAAMEKAAERKFRALLRYDAFDEAWKVEAFDIALRDTEFQSKRVYEALE